VFEQLILSFSDDERVYCTQINDFNSCKNKKDITCDIHIYQFNSQCSTIVLYVGVNFFTLAGLNRVKIGKVKRWRQRKMHAHL
jgi:hypothetical protein